MVQIMVHPVARTVAANCCMADISHREHGEPPLRESLTGAAWIMVDAPPPVAAMIDRTAPSSQVVGIGCAT